MLSSHANIWHTSDWIKNSNTLLLFSSYGMCIIYRLVFVIWSLYEIDKEVVLCNLKKQKFRESSILGSIKDLESSHSHVNLVLSVFEFSSSLQNRIREFLRWPQCIRNLILASFLLLCLLPAWWYQIVLLPAKGEENGVDSQNQPGLLPKWRLRPRSRSDSLSELIPKTVVQKKMK